MIEHNNEAIDIHNLDDGIRLKDIFVSVIVLIVIIISWFIIDSYDSKFKETKAESLKNSSIISSQVNSIFEQIQTVLIIASEELANNKIRPSEIEKYLYKRSLLIPDIEAIVIFDEVGNVVSSSSSELSILSSKNDLDFINLKQNNNDHLVVSSPFEISKDTFYFRVNHRISNSSNQFKGMLSVLVPIQFIHKILSQFKISPRSELNLINLNDCTVLVNNLRRKNSAYINSDYCSKKMKNKTENIKTSYIDNAASDIFTLVSIPNFKLLLLTVNSHKDFLNPFYSQVAFMASLIILILATYWFLINKQLKAELKLKEKNIQMINSSKMATIGEMASGIAHEVNNPLSIIKGRLQQATRTLQNKENLNLDLIEKSIQTALIATDRISKIVLGMKAISRGNTDDNFEVISVEKLFSNTMIFCQEKFKNANVDLIVAEYPVANISCRETQVSQVILNLLNNASDAIEDLEEKWVKVDFNLLPDEHKIQFVITDSGNGIPEAVLNKIMTPFFTTKAVGKGTGLGLSISQNIIKEHGGTLEYNKLSPKTQFIITLNYTT